MDRGKRGRHLLGVTFGITLALVGVALARGHARGRRDAGIEPAASALTPEQMMLWKYVARCALAEGQTVAPPGAPGGGPRLEGGLGLAPEWRDGRCDDACQEKVSACLFALTNPTGKHVKVSLLSAAPGLVDRMGPSDEDLGFSFQEGAFFGNVFAGEAYVCHGRDAAKGAEVKRFCAIAPGLCSGLAPFVDAGGCNDSCEMSCSTLSDGSRRCAAVRCRDPQGRVWARPITTYLRDRIEAGNADAIVGATERDTGLEAFEDGAEARYRAVDFGPAPGGVRHIVANLAARQAGGRIEVWLDGRRRLGVLPVRDTGGVARDLRAPLHARGLAGPHEVVLKFAGLDADVHLADIALR